MEPTAIEPQRIASCATDDAFETQVTHRENVIALTTDQNIGSAVTNENVVPTSAVHHVGSGCAIQRVSCRRPRMRDRSREVSTKDHVTFACKGFCVA